MDRKLIIGAGKRLWPIGFIFFFLLTGAGAVQAEEILVSAAASLTDALKEIGRAYGEKSRDKILFNFGASSELARQIYEGAPADLFFSADLEKMDRLEKEGRIEPGSQKNLLSNRLVVVVPLDSRLALRSPADLLRPEVGRIAIAEPSSVPVGIYARRYLESEGIWQRVRAKAVPVLDVRAALASVESGNVDAGFVYETDAAISKKVKVAYQVPAEKGPRIVYPVALVKEPGQKRGARNFLEFLLSGAAKKIFESYGFTVLE